MFVIPSNTSISVVPPVNTAMAPVASAANVCDSFVRKAVTASAPSCPSLPPSILNIFKRSGYYFVNTDVKIEENSNNTVNIVYEIDRGEKATISEIKFIGDKKFKDRKLNSIVTSEENKFWKFISKGKYLNIDRVELDKRLLKNFYLNKGYYNVEITDAYSSIIDKENFILTFNINAGEKFNFGKFKFLFGNKIRSKSLFALISASTTKNVLDGGTLSSNNP